MNVLEILVLSDWNVDVYVVLILPLLVYISKEMYEEYRSRGIQARKKSGPHMYRKVREGIPLQYVRQKELEGAGRFILCML